MDNPTAPVQILDIPDLVMQKNLLPYLRLDDLFRLRRVCKGIKTLADEHIRLHHVDHLGEVEITEDNGAKSFTAFLAMGIPAARVYLNNKTVNIFEHKDFPEFLELYADKITHLRVHHFFAFANEKEKPFYEALKNLQHLELKETDATKWSPKSKVPIPSNFKNLKSLKFGHITTSNDNDHGYWEAFVMSCGENLEYLRHPLYDHPTPAKDLKFVKRVLAWRAKEYPGKPNLKFYDLENFKDPGETEEPEDPEETEGGYYFTTILEKCCEDGLKVLNVDSELLTVLLVTDWETYERAVVPLVSLRNVCRGLFQWELPNVEKAVITSTSKSSYYPFWKRYEGTDRPLWYTLKSLDLTVDSLELEVWDCMENIHQNVTALYEFFFKDVMRTELTELALRFDEEASRKFVLPCPKVVHLKASCPFLKVLTLVNWVGTNKALSKLWDGLECLEELGIQDCRELGKVAFVGENKEEPSFLKLKGLKTLRLKGLDLMPKVTDTVFSLVFRKMKLKKFFLESGRPLETISETGIKSLLTGEFVGSIEKFPFRGWSLAGVPEEKFKLLEKEFRSYYMI